MGIPAIAILLVGAIAPVAAPSRVVTIEAERDATLIESPSGAFANGTGPLFVGRTNQTENSRRRAVVRFDVEDALPPRAIIESVELTLFAQPSNLEGTIEVHRVLEDWTEGPTFSGGGGGRMSQPGDATWLHSSYPFERWVRPGGHYIARFSAATTVEGPGPLSWSNTRHMTADVRLWQHAPARNFGWILIGDETTPQNATAFASSEAPEPELRPRLTIRFRLPGPW